MPRKDVGLVKAAQQAYAESNGDIRLARHIFEQKKPTHRISNVCDFINRWGKLEVDSPDTINVHDKPRAGRPRKLTEAEARQVASELKRGGRGKDRKTGYPSIKAATETNKRIKDIKNRTQASNRTLVRAAKRADPNLGVKHRVRLRPVLSNVNKVKRRKAGRKLIRKSLTYRKRIFYIDSKKFYIQPKARKTWGPKDGKERIIVDSRKSKSWRDVKCLNYFVVVNWFTGAVYLQYVTGTQGLPKGRFQVSQTTAVSLLLSCLIQRYD